MISVTRDLISRFVCICTDAKKWNVTNLRGKQHHYSLVSVDFYCCCFSFSLCLSLPVLNPLFLRGRTNQCSYTAVHSSSPMFAIDCEMVRTKIGSELARVTMVDELNSVVFDRLVRPENPVEDYLTRLVRIGMFTLEW